ncbi:MAG: ABC transporter permease, partial [Gemmatimonadota bacterium]|nr:ABC transporter permease [Gemmatimonadota bacterium]
MKPPPRLLLHRATLRAFPKAFRRNHGKQTLALVRASLAAARARGGLRTAWRRTLVDLVRNLPGAWRDAASDGLRSRRRQGGTRGVGLGPNLWRGARRVLRSPGYAASVALTLGVSLGALGSVAAMVERAILEPLPYEHSDRLLMLTETSRGDRISTAYLNYLDWRREATTLEEMGMFVPEGVTWTGDGPASRHLSVAASSSLFPTLGVGAAIGRTLSDAADLDGGPLEVVLSDAFWKSAFGGDSTVVGRYMVLNDATWEIVGIMPPNFDFPGGVIVPRADMLTSIGPSVPTWQDRGSHPGIYVIGRVADSSSQRAARTEMNEIAQRLASVHPENREEGIFIGSVKEEVLGDLDEGLRLLALAAFLLVGVGLANALSLASARALARRPSYRIARALGASRRDLAVEAAAEGLAVGAMAAAISVLGAAAVLWGFRDNLVQLPRLSDLDPGIGGALTLSALAISVAVAVQIIAARPFAASGSMAPSVIAPNRHAFRARSSLVAAQVALTLLLASSSGVLLKSLASLSAADGGIDPSGTLTLRLALPAAGYEGEGRTRVFYDQAIARIEALPGVESVGGISTLPFSGAGSQSRMAPSDADVETGLRTDVNVVFDDYFQAMGIERIAGRWFGSGDDEAAPPVVIVDERFAERFWSGDNPLGKTVSGWGLESAEVVGVVRHVKNYGVAAESREELYMPHRQRPFLAMYLVIRTALPPEDLLDPIRNLVAELDPGVPVTSARTMASVVDRTTLTERLSARMAWAMASIAGLLAFFGAYALIANSVANRRREMGIRMALGADGPAVRRHVFLTGVRIAAVGLAAGLLLSLAGADLLDSLLFGVDARAPDVYLLATMSVALLSALAVYLPARHAAHQDPAEI